MLHTIRRAVLGTQVLSCSFTSLAFLALSLGFGPRVALAQWDGGTKVSATDGASSDQFGVSVSISGDVAVIGAHLNNDSGTNSGSAYVFRLSDSTWAEEQKLLASDGAPEDRFGSTVAVSGNVAIVGAYLDDDNGTNSGSAYVFRFNGTTWVQEQKLTPLGGAASDYFGYSVAISGNVAVVGACAADSSGTNSGSAYVFRHNGSTWNQETTLLASDGAASDYFGIAVAVEGDVAVVGAHADDDNGSSSGSAYVFGFNGSSWIQEAKLSAADGSAGDRLGRAVDISGDVVVVGARDDDDLGTNSGSAYVFRFNGSSWSQDAKLMGSDGAVYDRFGHSVAVSGSVVMVGAYRSNVDPFQDSGSAYVFRYSGSSWSEEAKLVAPDAYFWDFFGSSVSVDDEAAVVGAYSEDSHGTDSGSAYFFASAGGPVACTDNTQCDDSDPCTWDVCTSSGTCWHGVNCSADCPG